MSILCSINPLVCGIVFIVIIVLYIVHHIQMWGSFNLFDLAKLAVGMALVMSMIANLALLYTMVTDKL